jgi:DNA-binding LacI/PurR family transcriptional regulator
VIAASDPVAAGVVQGARERGWSIPADLSVTGWDNNLLGGYLQPTLTTVQVDHRKLGRSAMARLVATLRQEPDQRPTASEGPLNTIIWRDSTGPVGAGRGGE